MELRIDARGQVVCVYGEAIDLAVLGEPTIRRASHVEPDNQGRWWAARGWDRTRGARRPWRPRSGDWKHTGCLLERR